jgi:hypothetical protein
LRTSTWPGPGLGDLGLDQGEVLGLRPADGEGRLSRCHSRLVINTSLPETKLKCEPSNVTGIVDRLESRGLAERRLDPADRRVKLAAATAAGRDTAERLRGSLDFAREPLAGLSDDERTVLRDLLQRMVGVLP